MNYLITKKNAIFIFLFKLFIFVYIFVDFIRRFFEGNKFILMNLDLIVLITFIYYLRITKFKILDISKISIWLRIYLSLFTLIIFFQIFNPYYYDAITYIVGVRSYLLAIPMIFIGYYFAKNKLLINQSMINFILFFVILSLFYAIFQLMTDYTKLVGTAMEFIAPMEHGVHSFGDKAVQLTSSFFASSKRYGHFLMIMYLLYLGITLNLQNKISIVVTMIFMVALVVSGARESFVLFLVIQIFLFLKFSNIKSKIIILIISIIVLLLGVYFISDNLLFKLKFLLSSPDEYLRRIYQFFPPPFVEFNNPNMLFGLGVGKYGQESLLNPNILNLTHGIDKTFFHSLDFFGSTYGFMDAGLAKVFIELGFFGIVVYILFLINIIILAIQNISYVKQIDYLKFSLSIFILLWIIYMLKAHPNISDIFMSYFLYFSIGYISFKEKKKVEICN